MSSIHSSGDGPLDCFHLLAVVNDADAAVNMNVQVSAPVSTSTSFGCIPRRAIPGSYGSYVCNLLRNNQVVFHSNCIIVRFLSAIHESSNISISSLTCYSVISSFVAIPGISASGWGFDVHFPND